MISGRDGLIDFSGGPHTLGVCGGRLVAVGGWKTAWKLAPHSTAPHSNLIRFTDVCGWTVGWIIKRYRNLVLKNSSRISLYDICFCEPISYSSYDIPRRENAHENTLPQLYVSHNCPSTTFIMSGSAQPVFTSMQLWREKTGCT